jgi:hypothetical protein
MADSISEFAYGPSSVPSIESPHGQSRDLCITYFNITNYAFKNTVQHLLDHNHKPSNDENKEN